MIALKPYLLRAIYEWIVDNDLTPHLLVDANYPNVYVPQEFVEDGKIVLNLRPQAIQGLSIGNDEVLFNARFNGMPTQIATPMGSRLAIYAKENGRGMVFDPEDAPPPEDVPEKKPPKKSHLRVVK